MRESGGRGLPTLTRVLLLLLLLASLATGSQVVLPVEEVEVVGNQQLSPDYIRQVTGLEVGSPWLWAWPYRLQPLLQNPWVRTAQLERPAIRRLRIVLEERKSIANLRLGPELYGLSADGVLLPGAPRQAPLLVGQGQPPLADLVLLVQTFPQAERIRYGVGGYQVEKGNLRVWGRTVRELQDWAKASRIGPSAAINPLRPPDAGRIYVYSWGVSARR
ncbi:Cell division protein FtsQ [Meiothermus luteus]|uniref:Cell division protein FtsQ n=1 Tax=Meiothermus luteus TaxID=2026184 RepID=A0A399EUZ1_9DEIN|nr:FtsQ-type POTRA domain-containing protein [Meiothermus luteus]RIH86442.1 Cell division protein FtsQ [Meiothermus luteus]RMH56553.1 MAG: FtsQ-type POTRA domain-containing protein [Deinococcota bacterium]